MKKIKTGFSMVELLFVMAVMAGLAAIAIPNLASSGDSARFTSMKSDTLNLIAVVEAEKLLNNGVVTDPEETLGNGDIYGTTKLKLTNENRFRLSVNNDCLNGYDIHLWSTGFVGYDINYDSCIDSSIRATTPNS